jgi:hypothetical protein
MSGTLRFALASFPLLAGCHGYLQPTDVRPLPARSIATRSGGEIEARDGELYLRPHQGDIGVALGVSLVEDGNGITVANRLRPDTRLDPGDRIVIAAPVLPPPENERAEPRDPAKVAISKLRPPPENFAILRDLREAQTVRSSRDLAGYAAGTGWLALDLGVIRAGKEMVLRQKVEEVRTWIPVHHLDPDGVFRQNGVELCTLEDVPNDARPPAARPADVLVLRVARGCLAGRTGLRPLDLITNVKEFERTGRAAIRTQKGEKTIVIEEATRRDIWIPLLLSWEEGGMRSHIGFGPLDIIFHRSTAYEYNEGTDHYDSAARWSFLGTIQSRSRTEARGSLRHFGIDPVLDQARIEYAFDRLEKSSEKNQSPSWRMRENLEESLGAE